MKKPFLYIAVLGLILLACFLAVPGFFAKVFHGNDTEQDRQRLIAQLTAAPEADSHPAQNNFVAAAAAKVWPSVVAVHVVGKEIDSSGSPFFGENNDPFQQFFGPQHTTPKGAGSGVIISPDGYIITNNHVVKDTVKVTVNVGDTSYDARVIGTDPISDIAVVKIDTHGTQLSAATLGNSDGVRIGDWAIAVGNPLNVGTTVTLGIISAVNRTGLSAEGHDLNAVLQTDAAINPGNSGGALADIDGQVIGINEAIESPTGAYIGIGFAIPVNGVKRVAAELIRNGKVVYPYLGVSYAPLKSMAPDERKKAGIVSTADSGAVVMRVYPGSPADQAGLKVHDIILEANNRKIVETSTLGTLIQQLTVGNTVTLVVDRAGQIKTITVTLRERPSSFGRS